ncbi:MAG: hypothetical protein NVSMB21_02210 [Vulcanimicrobiaceae bacterium]
MFVDVAFERDDAQPRTAAAREADQFEAFALGATHEGQVHEQHVEAVEIQERSGFQSRRRRSDDGETLFAGEQFQERGSRHVAVGDDGDRDVVVRFDSADISL